MFGINHYNSHDFYIVINYKMIIIMNVGVNDLLFKIYLKLDFFQFEIIIVIINISIKI